ncbi:MAG TPA: family 10 glycosylhydrolase, partial [Candidatus Sumerlaeota bacterium]|nr:family 10 glycosylhydrolase [Candidatus Sumerlaeota bacterium]
MKNLRVAFYLTFILCLFLGGGSRAKAETPEFRALWITRFEWPSEDAEKCKENILQIFTDMEKANFNTAVFQVRGQCDTLYPSTLEPWSPLFGSKDPGFDPLA